MDRREPWDWLEGDIRALIDVQVTEGLQLEYKRSAALAKTDRSRQDIGKDVSAFANSAGGTIVYGIAERDQSPEGLDEGVDPREISREWIEQVVSSQVRPRIEGVRINQVTLSSERAGRVAYVVHVPQSSRGPHMAGDKRYWKRLEHTIAVMEDYEVRDVARRGSVPDLEILLALPAPDGRLALEYLSAATESVPFELSAAVVNHSPTPVEHFVVKLFIDTRVRIASRGDLTLGAVRTFEDGVAPEAMQGLQKNWTPLGQMPVWKGMRFKLTDEPVTLAVPVGPANYGICWEVYAPGMVPGMAPYALGCDGATAFLEGRPPRQMPEAL